MLARRHLVALVDVAGERVRVAGDPPRLPALDDEWPDHRALVAARGDPRAMVAAPPLREDDGTVVNVLRWSGAALPDGRWLPLADASALDLPDDARGTLLARAAELRGGVPDDGREQWFVPGWADDVDAWVGEVLTARGEQRAGPAEWTTVWSLSAVGRYPLRDGGATWFKATCRGFAVEVPITLVLADLAPEQVPRVVAADPERAWLLLEPLDTEIDVGLDRLRAVAAGFARLQLAAYDRLDALRAAGAPDRGEAATVAALAGVVHDGVERPTMTDEQRASAAAIEPWLAEQVVALHAVGPGPTLVHGDLHLGNVAWDAAAPGPVFFDWTDACVAHPYLDGRHLAFSATHHAGAEGGDAVREAYLDVWREARPDVDHDRAWELAEVGDRVFTLVSYEGIYRAQPPWARWELATIGIDLLDRLAALHAERSAGPTPR